MGERGRARRSKGERRPLRFWAAMLFVFGVALLLRVGASTFVPNGSNCPGTCFAGNRIQENVGGDSVHYVLAGRALADGRGFVAPESKRDIPYAQQPPLWTVTMGGTEIVGLHSVFAKRLLFAVLGSATAVLVGLAARQVASERVGIVAGAIAAVYPGFWLHERNLGAETIVFPLMAVVLILAYRYRARPGWGPALALGAAVGVLCLARSEQVLVVPLLVVPLILFTRDVAWPSRVGRLAAAGAMIVFVLAPWTLYNLGRFEKPVILSTGFGYTAKAGACDSTFNGERLGSYDFLGCLLNVLPPTTSVRDGSVDDSLLRKAALNYTTEHLGRLPVVIAVREGRTWSLVSPKLQLSLNGQLLNAPTEVLWLQLAFYWALLVPAIAGAVILRRRHVLLYPLLAFPITVIISTAVTFGDSRYRAAAEVALVILAAVALEALIRRQFGSESKEARSRDTSTHLLASS